MYRLDQKNYSDFQAEKNRVSFVSFNHVIMHNSFDNNDDEFQDFTMHINHFDF